MKMKNIFYKAGTVLIAAIAFTGCKDFFDPESVDMLQDKDYIGSYTELYSGYMGVAACVQQVADKAIYLEGLRSDLLEPTPNASQEFWDVYNYKDVMSGTAFTDKFSSPDGYYKVILNANDFIAHALKFHEENPRAIEEEQFKGLVGGAIRFKVWAYLMLAKIYGEAIYYDDSFTQYQDISRYDLLKFDQIIQKCYDLMVKGTGGYNGMYEFDWATFLVPLTGSAQDMATRDLSENRKCPPPYALMAELNLWIGNYQGVVNNFIEMLNAGYVRYDGDYSQSDFGIDQRGRKNNQDYINVFNRYYSPEHVAVAVYSTELQQTNNVINYFSAHGNNSWYLTISKAAQNRYNTQVDTKGNVYTDYRGAGQGIDMYKEYNGKLEFRKFTAGNESADKQSDASPYRSLKVISLYRAKDIYMFAIEAFVQLGRFNTALLLLNGEGNDGSTTRMKLERGSDGQYLPGAALEGLPARLGGIRYSNGDGWSCQGIRSHIAQGRVENKQVGYKALPRTIPVAGSLLGIDNPLSDPTYLADPIKSKKYLDSLIVEETIMEFAGESRGLFAMIRMSKRWGDETRRVWASKVAAKYNGGVGDNAIQQKLEASIDNWFIKYDLQY